PSGGIPPPRADAITREDVLAQIRAELREEVGIDEPALNGTLIGVSRDAQAFSFDLVFRCELPRPLEEVARSRGDWEYSEIRWIATDAIRDFVDAPENPVIPPTRALLAFLTWY